MPNGVKSEWRTKCTCDETEGDYHPCPYAEDVNNDPDSSCDCCSYCTDECAMDI